MTQCRLFLGKTKLTALALSTSPQLAPLLPLLKATTGLLFSPHPPSKIKSYFAAFHPTSFARAGAISPLTFVLPPGALYATGGQVEPEEDVLLSHTLEPMLRKNGIPTQLVKGRVMLENGYIVCREGEILGAAQTTLLKAFGVEASLFAVTIVGWWGEDIGCHFEKDDNGLLKFGTANAVQGAAEIGTGMDVDDVDDSGIEDLGAKADKVAHDLANNNLW